ncbi:MAG: hypothetical protein AAFV07_09110 [Bacteroidota bacterium]
MSRKVLFCLILLGPLSLVAQDWTETLQEVNAERIRLNKINMWVLGGWAVGNIAVGGIMRSQTTGSVRYFHEMNAIWNVVNLGLAAGGLYGAYTGQTDLSLWQTYQEQQQIEKILLFNMALNFSYLTAGVYLQERSRRTDIDRPERLKGYGQALLLQGGFLLLFDITQFWLHHHHATPKLQQMLEHVQMGPGGIGLTWGF